MGWDTCSYTLSFCARGGRREQEEEIGGCASMEGELKSMLECVGVNWSWINKNPFF
jgi:hypothetical protein